MKPQKTTPTSRLGAGGLARDILPAIAACALAVPGAGYAGVKYWDNPDYRAFDVDCYVSGAVWNYDGIRNAGATAAHDAGASPWNNLGAGGSTYDLTKKAVGTGGDGAWASDGYVFNGGTRWYGGASVTVSGSWTVQMLVDADLSQQTSETAAPVASVMIDWFAFLLHRKNGYFYARLNSASTTPRIVSEDGVFDYATVVLDNENLAAAMFSGTTPPTSGDGFKTFASAIASKSTTGYGLGSTSASGQQFVGTLKSFRYYQRVLTNEELAWNRVVDERRFFDRSAPLPVTNAVVATAVQGLEGVEPSGCYAIDEDGHAFTAPAVARLNGVKFRCTGYTLETWDDDSDDWGAAVWHGGELAAQVASGDLVRITWQWKDATGLGVYDVHDYVWDGLELFYDGICNVGTNAAHSSTATTWKNLGSAGATNDIFLQLLNAGGTAWTTATGFDEIDGRDPGAWTDTGFALTGDSRFRVVNTGGSNGAINTGTDYSLQTLLDANAADQTDSSAFVFSLSADKYSFVLYKSGRLDWRSDSATSSGTPLSMSGTSFDYATAIANDTDNTLSLFSGTNFPSDGDGYRQFESITAHGQERGYDLGGYGNANYDKLLTGTIRHFRQYDHALSPAEVLRNRKVDDWRYFGRATVTNVVVQSTCGALRGHEADGAYEVAGESYTFTAPATATILVNGKALAYACAGYTVETWDGSAWGDMVLHEGVHAFAYTASAGLVRLTWLWKGVGGLRTAADYSYADYSQAGLYWHYDGLLNQGVGNARSTATDAQWVNLGSAGAEYDMTKYLVGSKVDGEWTDDGYLFRGGTRFRVVGKPIGPFRSFTLQTLVEADVADQTSGKRNYIMSGMWNYFSLALESRSVANNGSIFSYFQGTGNNEGTAVYFRNDSGRYDFATGIMDYDAKTAQFFGGVKPPASGTGFHQFASVTSRSDSGFGLGNGGGDGTEGLVGTVKSFRYYDRVLTEEELVRNRNADAARYFGALGVTNVVVAVEEDSGIVPAETAGETYFVEGAYTFTATGPAGIGYRLSVPDGNGGWQMFQPFTEGASYDFDKTDASTPACVKIEWCVQKPFVMVVR